MNMRCPLIAGLAWLGILAGVQLPAAETPRPQRLAPPRHDLDPLILTGQQLPGISGEMPERIVAFVWQDGWQQVPVQIDERKQTSLMAIRGRRGRGTDVEAVVYCDANTRCGADTDKTFDADDELVLLMAHAGGRAPVTAVPEHVSAEKREEVVVAVGDQLRYFYLFASDGKLDPSAGQDLVRYKFHSETGQFAGPGPNPEDSTVTTDRYENHFSDRWIHDATRILTGGSSGVDVLDRDKFQFKPGICGRTTLSFSLGDGAFIANRDGPLRVIRSVIGANSGALTQKDWLCYPGRMDTVCHVRVHPIRATWFFYDFSPEAVGMTYFDNLNPRGVKIDGVQDEMKNGALQWQFVTGEQGSLAMALGFETNIPTIHWHSYYFDQKEPDWNQCTGDDFAYAASGAATADLPDTDGGSPHRLVLYRSVYYEKPNLEMNDAQPLITAAWFPPAATSSKEIAAAAARVRQIVAHRGSSTDRPENTLASTRRAIEAGATAIEVDVRTTKDGELVLLHDGSLDRTTNGKGSLKEITFAELRQLDAGSWFDEKYAGLQVPTLGEVLEVCRGKIDVLLDLKEQDEAYTAKVIAAVNQHGDPRRTIVGVRSVEQAIAFRKLLPQSRQLGLMASPKEIEAYAAAGVETLRLWPHWLVDETLVPRVRKTAAKLHLNGTDGTPEELLPLLQHQPDSLSSDNPGRLVESLQALK